jgi:Icc-related predicted phosphoesterase
MKDKLVAVTGNMDDVSIARGLREIGVLIDGNIIVKNNIIIAGVGGIDPITSLEEVESKIESFEKVDILVSHHPPKGAVDRTFFGVRAGLRELRAFIEKYRPKLHLCGHIHEARGVERIGDTTIVNPGPLMEGFYAIIRLNNEVNVTLKRL